MAAKKPSSKRIVLRTGEALVEGDLDYLCAEPEIVIGEMDGPVGIAFANLLGNQIKGHTKVFCDSQQRCSSETSNHHG